MAAGPSALKALARAAASWPFALGLLCVQLLLCWRLPASSGLAQSWWAAARVPLGLALGTSVSEEL